MPPPFIFRVALADFLDQPQLEHPFDGTIQRSRTQAEFAMCPFGDILHDGVAVRLSRCQCNEDLEEGRRQGKKLFDPRIGILRGFATLGAHYIDHHYTDSQYNESQVEEVPFAVENPELSITMPRGEPDVRAVSETGRGSGRLDLHR